jgi:hypothetical protein
MNADLLKQFDHVIPLGYVCTVSNVLRSYNRFEKATAPFECLGTPMWAVDQLIANNFEGFLADMGKAKFFDGYDKEILFDKRYAICAAGEDVSAERFQHFCKAAQARGAALMNLIRNPETKSVLFVRHERPANVKGYGARLPREEFAQYQGVPELEYVNKFVETVKSLNPKLDFRVLFINEQAEPFVSGQIIGVPSVDHDFRNPHIVEVMTTQLVPHSRFLQEKLVLPK